MKNKRIIRISIKNSIRYIYIYIIDKINNNIITSVSTKNIEKNKNIIGRNNVESAKIIGINVLKYLKKIKFSQIELNIYNKKYHGKIKIISEIIKNKYKLL